MIMPGVLLSFVQTARVLPVEFGSLTHLGFSGYIPCLALFSVSTSCPASHFSAWTLQVYPLDNISQIVLDSWELLGHGPLWPFHQ